MTIGELEPNGSLAAATPRTAVVGRLPALSYSSSIFLSALLLFLMEPMIGRLLLPNYGGSPAVWNTCMVAFQALLLVGYGWAHWGVQALGIRRQAAAHAVLLLLSLAVLPLVVPQLRPSAMPPIVSVFAGVVLTIGLPFVVLASNSSLVQRWYSLARKDDPFWLYAISNAGSLIGLLGYPLLFEPLFGLSNGWRTWVGLYLLFIASSAWCLVAAWRVSRAQPEQEPVAHEAAGVRPGWKTSAGWMFRAAVASSLLLSVTMKITTDLASAPILWVVPLSLYLASFIMAFSSRMRLPRAVVATFTAIGIAWAFASAVYTLPSLPLWISMGGLLATVFFGSLLCHGDLADSRPSPHYLTQFYLWIAVGGVVGGILNSIVAPVIFESLVEYPITLLLLAILIHARGGYMKKFPRERMRALATYMPALTVLIALIVSAAMIYRHRHGNTFTELEASTWEIVPLGLVLLGLLLARHAGQMEFALACLTIYTFAFGRTADPVVAQVRSFFGVTRVFESPTERLLVHGTTVHGAQWRTGPLVGTPLRYYYPTGPFGERVFPRHAGARIGIVGLGAGSLAALGSAGQQITFIDIDPDVETLARGYFTYLRDSKATVDVRIGDGRLLLNGVPDHFYDLLILDAFSSDSIPTHLLTVEAIGTYLRKVKPDGLVVVHVSNRFFDLRRVFRAWESVSGKRAAVFFFEPNAQESADGATATTGIAFAPDEASVRRLVDHGRWRWLGPGKSVLWTDDRVDLIAALGQLAP